MPDLVNDVDKYRRGWTGGLPETPCGYGSRLDQTEAQREWLPRMVEKYGIRSIADIGAGDLNWMRLVEWPHPVEYRAYDLVPRHEMVQQLDIIQAVPPKADAVLILWVLNHLPEDHAARALANIRASGCRYLFLTWERRQWACTDLPALEHIVIRHRHDERGDVELRLVQC